MFGKTTIPSQVANNYYKHGFYPLRRFRQNMRKDAFALSIMLLLMPLSGCLGNDESQIGCPENPPDGTTCVSNQTSIITGNGELDLLYAKAVDLSGFDLRDADLSGAMLAYANLSGADLSGADLSGSIIKGANLIGAKITGTNFEGAIYDQYTFWYSGWNDKDGDGILDDGRVPEQINKEMIYLGPGSNIDGVNLDGRQDISFLPALELDGIVFPGSFPANLSHSSLRDASFRNIELGLFLSNFSNSDLTGADFSGSSLILNDLANADLTGANFSESTLIYTDLSGTDLSSAELHDIHFHMLLECPMNLPEGWLCISDPFIESPCPVADEESEEGAEYSMVMGDLLDSLDLSDCSYYILGPTAYVSIPVKNVDLTGLDLSFKAPEGIMAVNLTGCPSSLFVEYMCTGGTILGPSVRLIDVDLSGFDLKGVNLSGSIVVGVNLNDADLSNANLNSINWLNTICPDGTNSDNNENTCENNL